MNLDTLIQAQIDGKLIRASFFLLVKTDTPVRAWGGNGDFVLPVDTVETTGGTYGGVGVITDMPSFDSLFNGTAARVDFVVSGVDQQIVDLADADAEEIRSKAVHVGLQFLDENWQPLADIIWIWEGEADVIKTDSTSTPDFNRLRSVTLSVGSVTTGRRRPVLSYFTRAEQRRRSPTDAFCDRTALYSQGTALKWPP